MQDVIRGKKEYLLFFVITAFFLFFRLPAIDAPYHQDEYKWPMIVNPALAEPGGIPHPPLGEFIYRATFKLFGSDNFRITPLIFSVFNLALIYIIVRRRYGTSAALWSSLFFTLSFYGILASVMVDTDGAILPFFFLLSLWFYDSFNIAAGKKKWLWLGLLFSSILAGILVKMSFILAIGAIVLDFLISERYRIDRRKIGWYILALIGFGIIAASGLYVAQSIFEGFDLSKSANYWETFIKGFADRNFFQSAIQFFKSLLYLSPFLVFAGIISIFPYRKDLKIFHIFIFLGLVFYLVLFDFSAGALDRYFQFMIVPLCIIAGVMTSTLLSTSPQPLSLQRRGGIKGGVILGLILVFIFLLQFINHFILPLHPKSEWIDQIISLKWNFLYPFSGGSGPMPFYISFAFIGLMWVLGAILLATYFRRPDLRKGAFTGLLIVGLVYNAIFTEEYLFGKINGSAPYLVKDAVAFIEKNPDIKKVVVYNDNGGNEVQKTGKYERRLYAVPAFEQTYREFFKDFSGHILYIDIPKTGENNFYSNYLESCNEIYNEQDKYITARILECK